MAAVWSVVQHALMITAFVAAMMIAIEYVNVQSRGLWMRALGRSRLRQYLLASLLGASPGCLGAYVVVALYVDGRVTVGAVVAAMIATSGDEGFVMMAVVPGVFVAMTAGLAVAAVGAAALTDRLLGPRGGARPACDSGFAVHAADEAACRCFPGWAAVRAAWRPPSPWRATVATVVAVFALALVAGAVGPPAWSWVRVTFLAVSAFVLFVVATVPEHFLEEHVWRHVLRSHVPRIFLWTAGTLAVMALVESQLDLAALVADNRWLMLALALAVSVIPESGPHLVFVTLYAAGTLPLGVLVASSAAQDGHGMLPMLAHSRRDFVRIKAVNVVVGALLGAALLLIEGG